jgi:hypothetical protein
MDEQKYFLVLTGTILGGREEKDAVAALEQILRLPRVKAYSMLQGKRSRIRKELTKERADRLQLRLVKAGVGCFTEPVNRQPESQGQTRATVTEEQMRDSSPLDASTLDAFALDSNEELSAGPGQPSVANVGEGHERLSLDLSTDEESLLSEPSEMRVMSLELEPLAEAVSREMRDEAEALSQGATTEGEGDQDTGEDTAGVAADSDTVAGMSEDPGRFFEQPSLRSQPLSAEGRGDRQSRIRIFAVVGGLLLLAVVGWVGVGLLGGEDEPSGAVLQEEPKPPVDPMQAQTEARMIALGRSVKVWMIQYGFGFDPQQVTLARVQGDLGLSQEGMLDAWGTPLRYQPESGRYSVLSAGADRSFGTGDDLTETVHLQ